MTRAAFGKRCLDVGAMLIVAGACFACHDDEQPTPQPFTLVVLERDGTPVCSASVVELASDTESPLVPVSACNAIYEIEVAGSTTVEARAPGFATRRVTLEAAQGGHAVEGRCSLIWMDPVAPASGDAAGDGQ